MSEELQQILYNICVMFNEGAEVDMAFINSPKEFCMDTVGDVSPITRKKLIANGWIVSKETKETKRIRWSLVIKQTTTPAPKGSKRPWKLGPKPRNQEAVAETAAKEAV